MKTFDDTLEEVNNEMTNLIDDLAKFNNIDRETQANKMGGFLGHGFTFKSGKLEVNYPKLNDLRVLGVEISE